MKIAMLTNNYKPFVGGVPISIERLSGGLRSLGNEVKIFAPSYENQVEEDGVIRIRSLKKKLEGGCVMPDILDPELEIQFCRMEPDLIHVHHPMLMGYAALYLGRKYKVPVAFTYHTRYEEYLHNFRSFRYLQQRSGREYRNSVRMVEETVINLTKNQLVPAHMRAFANLCDVVFAPTPAMEEYLRGQGVKTQLEVLPTGLRMADFMPDTGENGENGLAGGAAGLRHKLAGDKKYLLCTVSRLTKEKNLVFLIQGLASLKARIGGCFRLLMIGGGPMEEELRGLVRQLDLEDNVTFMGTVDNAEIGRYYRACDLFVFASKSETQGIVLLEAMAARNPVVAVDASGVCDIVKNGINGFKTGEDRDEWAGRIGALLLDGGGRERLGQGAYETALGYREDFVARRAQAVYRQLILGREERRRQHVGVVY